MDALLTEGYDPEPTGEQRPSQGAHALPQWPAALPSGTTPPSHIGVTLDSRHYGANAASGSPCRSGRLGIEAGRPVTQGKLTRPGSSRTGATAPLLHPGLVGSADRPASWGPRR